jgi:hypothetical protein
MEQKSKLLVLFSTLARRFKFDKPTDPAPDIEFIPELREDEPFYPGVSDEPTIQEQLRDSGVITGWGMEGAD